MANLSDLFPAVAGATYMPAMMVYAGSEYYSNTTVLTSGNLVTLIFRFSRASFSGNTAETIFRLDGPANRIRAAAFLYSNDFTTTARRDKLLVVSQNSAGTNICRLLSIDTLCDGAVHNCMYSFNATTGAATFIVDGASADDTGSGERVAPTTGTLDSGVSSACAVGASPGGVITFNGALGFVGYDEQYLTSAADFFDGSDNPIEQDEAVWANSGFGAQPVIWNQHGDMVTNAGSAGAFGLTGDIAVTIP